MEVTRPLGSDITMLASMQLRESKEGPLPAKHGCGDTLRGPDQEGPCEVDHSGFALLGWGSPRFKSGSFDVMPVVGHVGPPQVGRARPAWEKGVRQLLDWMFDQFDHAPVRCLPFMYLGLNCGVGMGSNGV